MTSYQFYQVAQACPRRQVSTLSRSWKFYENLICLGQNMNHFENVSTAREEKPMKHQKQDPVKTPDIKLVMA